MSKKHGIAAIIFIILVGLVTNAKNVRTQLSIFSEQGVVVAPKSNPSNLHSLSQGTSGDHHDVAAANCLKARKDTVPASLYLNLPKPFINLGFPKMGTSSLHAFFECGGLVSHHYKCGKDSKKCGVCTRESVEAGLPPLSQCGKGDMYAQIDDGAYFPQIELLEEFVHGHPNATFFLTFRSMEKWYHSITHWPPRKNGPHMDERFKKFNITGSPTKETKSNPKEFGDWYCKHVERVRQLVARNPSHTLVEVDIEDPGIDQRMEDIFGIKKSCWGHTNVNPIIHPDVNQSEVVLSKAFRRKNGDDDVETQPGSAADDDKDDQQTHRARENGDYESHATEENTPSQSSDINNNDYSSRACFKARNDTVPASLYHNLPKPFINLGFPKMGTSSLHSFFECGGLVSYHYQCGRGSKKCGVCTRESVEAGLPPLSQCGKGDMYAQIDDGVFFPQIELLEEFVHGHPNATFFLTFRSMEKWYHSITHWPPRKNGPHMDERFKKFNITGSPTKETKSNPKEFSDWYCNHVERVRDIVARNPSHTLVEVDIEDPGIDQRMEDVFGIKKSCWGHTNVNPIIHPEVNQSEVVLSKAFRRKNGDDDVETQPGSAADDDKDDQQTHRARENGDYESQATEENTPSQSSDINNIDYSNRACFKARNDTVLPSLYHNLPKPFINLGFPKMGTSSLHAFFECGGLKSRHYKCGNKTACGVCTKESVEAGLPPLSLCGKADMYAQIDNAKYFPQIELLEEFVHGHPNATFFLTFRSMEKWYRSLSQWFKLDVRLKNYNITGSPSKETKSNPKEFSDWYCKHVERVRDIVAQNPSHTLVEIDIEDPGMGQRMEDIFGIKKSCWGQTNVNPDIHPELNASEVQFNPMYYRLKKGVKQKTANGRQMKAMKKKTANGRQISHKKRQRQNN